jgi:dephospho-CoA kinase
MEKLFIGVVGTNGAGKSSVCNYLHTKGFKIYSLSDVVREEAKKLGYTLTRDNLVHVGNLLKEEYGKEVLAKKSFQNALDNNIQFAAFDSIRHIVEVKYFKNNGVIIWGVDASIENRYQRIKKRQKETDKVSFEEFVKQDEREYLGHSPGQNIKEALTECESIYDNNDTIEEMHQSINALLSTHQINF